MGVGPEGLAWDRQVLHACGQPNPHSDTSFTFSELEFEGLCSGSLPAQWGAIQYSDRTRGEIYLILK